MYEEIILKWIMEYGIIGGLIFIIWGNMLIGKPDKRFKNGWKNNRKPKWLPGIIFILSGLGWFVISLLFWMENDSS